MNERLDALFHMAENADVPLASRESQLLQVIGQCLLPRSRDISGAVQAKKQFPNHAGAFAWGLNQEM